MDDDQFSSMIIRVNKNKDIIPSVSQIILLYMLFIGSFIFIYYILS